MPPTVSVIVPNYNHAPYLRQRIDSILAQTYRDFELIIMDDHSPDDSRSIIETYRNHPQVSHIVFNETNGGNTFNQWEKGIQLASGKYIWIAESDDYAEPDFLQSLIPGFEKDGSMGIAFCESTWVDQHNHVVKNIRLPDTPSLLPGKEFIGSHMTQGNRIYNASMAVFRKDLFVQLPDQEYKNFRYCGDWLMWVQLAAMSKVFYLNQKKSYFRRHTTSVSYTSNKQGLFLLEGLQVQQYIKNKMGLDKAVHDRAARYWLRESLHQFLVRRNLSGKVFFKTMQLLTRYDAIVLPLFPIYLIRIVYKRILLKTALGKRKQPAV